MIPYFRNHLLDIRALFHFKPSMSTLKEKKKDCGIFKYRGRKAGRRKIRTVDSSYITSTELAFSSSLPSKGVNVNNLVVVLYKRQLVYARGEISLLLTLQSEFTISQEQVGWFSVLCFCFRSRYFSVTEKWFSHRIEATPPGFKMTDHSRVGGTGGGAAL